MNIYLELPEGKVPGELIDGSKEVSGIILFMRDKSGVRSKVAMSMPKPDRGARSRLYVINRPIEEIYADMTERMDEVMALRASVATMALVFGFDDDIPTKENKLGWEALAKRVAARAVQLDGYVTNSLEVLGLRRIRKS